MSPMIVICTLTRPSHLKRKNINEGFFLNIVACLEWKWPVRLFYTIRVQYKVRYNDTVSFCRTRVTRNLSIRETKMKKRDNSLQTRAQLFEGGLALHPGFFSLCSKAFSRIIFSVTFKASNHQLVGKRIKTKMLFKLSNLNLNLALTLSCLNPALNNSVLKYKPQLEDTR